MVRPSKLFATLLAAICVAQDICIEPASKLCLPDPPYDNYIYFDCHSSSHVILTSPLPSSNLNVIGPRLLVAWPAGNSGLVAYFEPTDGPNGTLTPRLENSTTTGETLDAIYNPVEGDDPRIGVSGSINFNVPARLTIPILGSIRTIRDFAEGPSILDRDVQGGLRFSELDDSGATINRTWFDNVTTTELSFIPLNGAEPVTIDPSNNYLLFGVGTYQCKYDTHGIQDSIGYTLLQNLAKANNSSQRLLQLPSPGTAQSARSFEPSVNWLDPAATRSNHVTVFPFLPRQASSGYMALPHLFWQRQHDFNAAHATRAQ